MEKLISYNISSIQVKMFLTICKVHDQNQGFFRSMFCSTVYLMEHAHVDTATLRKKLKIYKTLESVIIHRIALIYIRSD